MRTVASPKAGIGQIVFSRKPAVFFADDVVDFTSEKRIFLVNEAVLTEMACAIRNEPA